MTLMLSPVKDLLMGLAAFGDALLAPRRALIVSASTAAVAAYVYLWASGSGGGGLAWWPIVLYGMELAFFLLDHDTLVSVRSGAWPFCCCLFVLNPLPVVVGCSWVLICCASPVCRRHTWWRAWCLWLSSLPTGYS